MLSGSKSTIKEIQNSSIFPFLAGIMALYIPSHNRVLIPTIIRRIEFDNSSFIIQRTRIG